MKSFIIFLVVTVGTFATTKGDIIRIKGSDTLGAKLVPPLCELYRTQHPETSFEIEAEGSITAFTCLLDATADIGMSSREIKPAEAQRFAAQGITLSYHVASVDVLAIAVDAKNPVTALTQKQVEAIFTADVTHASQVGGGPGPISVYTRNRASGVYTEFKCLAMDGRDYISSAKHHGADLPMMSVLRDEQGITYVGLAYANAPGAKVLKIDGDEPMTALKTKYPYSRRNFYITREKPSASVQAFLEWATRSDEAMALVKKVGFLPPTKTTANVVR